MPCKVTKVGDAVVIACSRRGTPERKVVVRYEAVLARTKKAVLLRAEADEGGRKAEDWWPLSQCPDLESGEAGAHAVGDGPDYFEAPEWLARQKGWRSTR